MPEAGETPSHRLRRCQLPFQGSQDDGVLNQMTLGFEEKTLNSKTEKSLYSTSRIPPRKAGECMRILAIDYGDAHTGIAVSDPTGLLAGYTTTITAYRPEAVAERIAALAQEHGAEELVLGHPLNMDGTCGPRAEKAEALAELLRTSTGLPVILWDERRTTIDAHQILFNSGKNGRQRKKTVDAVAAALILEGYLTYKKTHP